MNSDSTYDLVYDDGDTECGVYRCYIRPVKSAQSRGDGVAPADESPRAAAGESE